MSAVPPSFVKQELPRINWFDLIMRRIAPFLKGVANWGSAAANLCESKSIKINKVVKNKWDIYLMRGCMVMIVVYKCFVQLTHLLSHQAWNKPIPATSSHDASILSRRAAGRASRDATRDWTRASQDHMPAAGQNTTIDHTSAPPRPCEESDVLDFGKWKAEREAETWKKDRNTIMNISIPGRWRQLLKLSWGQ